MLQIVPMTAMGGLLRLTELENELGRSLIAEHSQKGLFEHVRPHEGWVFHKIALGDI
jgi:hypothetical protein